MQTESITPSAPAVKKNSGSIFGIVLLVVLVLVVAGLGYWGYQLNNGLKATQSAQATLQGQYDELTTQKNTLTNDLGTANTDLDKAKKDLEKAKKDLETVQASVTKSKDQVTSLQGKVDKALLYLDVMVTDWVELAGIDAIGEKVKAVNDPSLTEKYDAWKKSKSSKDYGAFLAYVWSTLADLMKK